MPINVFTKSDLKNTNFTAEYTIKKNQRTINGTPVESATSDSAKVLQAFDFFQENGTVEPQNNTVSVNSKAAKMIESMGMSILRKSGYSNDFSILNGMRDKGNILSNPNIVDIKKFNTLEPGRVSPIDKFPDNSDPFYTLDEEPAHAIQLQNNQATQNEQNFIGVAAAFYEINVVNTSEKTLKQFKK